MLLETLGRAGATSDVIVFPEGQDVEIPGCRVFRVPALPGLGGVGPGFSVKKLLCDAIMLPMAAWRLASARYDLVIAVEEASFIALALKPVFRVPYVFDVDSSIPEQMNDRYGLPAWLHRILVAAERLAARNAVGAITCCRALEQIVREHAPGLPVRTIEDVTMIGPERAGERPEDIAGGEPAILYVGSLEPYQGIDLLLAAFARLDGRAFPSRLVVVGGNAAQIAAYREQARRHGVAERVDFLGPRPVEELGCYLRAATIVVSPRTQGRNTPMKVYSYLDSGRPLVATRLPTHTQVLGDDVAMLVEPEPGDMARGLGQLLANPALRDRLAAAARRQVQERNTPAAYARELMGFLQDEIAPLLARKEAGKAAS